ncbi:glycosyltransferase family 4 protein [Paremcibacter congregatus]|uniref:glycosyltransferase family 4 protein n=1 Tax=Paremcibacter congregatus TaxID=2043170 RepID=UPI0030EF7882|tara:strand:+ start:2017 stop:3249 length:1233 start_codon:yes stop_codon:yes gene_type:complete
MNILFLSDNFPPEGNAPATRLFEHATRWIEKGHQVTVITCVPNFPEGKVFEGYKNRLYQVEMMSGIKVVRVKTYITANEGFLKRTLDYISFMFMGFFAGLFQKRLDIIVATSPQFFCAIGGWMLSVVRRRPFIFELRDLWPASIKAVGAMEDSLLIRVFERIELFLYHRSDRIISVTHAFKKELVERGVLAEKIDVITNGVDLTKYAPADEKDPELAEQYNLKDKFVVGYVGTHGMAHALDKVVDTAELLQHEKDIVILFAGGGAARTAIEEQVAAKKLKNVCLIPRQPKEMMPRLWSLCDVSLIHLKNNPVFKTVIPSKLFESMGMGLPVLVGVPEGEITGIVEECECGINVEPENAEQMSHAILEMYKSPALMIKYQMNSLSSAPKYSREALANDMLTSFEAALQRLH